MAESTVACLYTITKDNRFPILEYKGFDQVKTCGSGVKGFITVVALNCIESMILRQKQTMSNIIFILPYLESMQQDPNFPLLSQIFVDIKESNADHTKFAQDSVNNPELINEIFNFSLSLFKVPSIDISVGELLQYLDPASTELNIQFMFYNEKELICEIKKNRYIYPSVLNFYYSESNNQCYMLYHTNYSEISVDNSNISEEFDLEIASNIEKADEDLMKEMVNKLSELENIDEGDKNELNSILLELKKVDLYGYEAEGLLKHLIS